MVLVEAPPAPRLSPDRLWPTDGGSGDHWGGDDGGGGGGGGWWGEDPEDWEADAPYQHSRTRRVVTLITVLVVGLASVGGYLVLLLGDHSAGAIAARVVRVDPVGTHPTQARVAFTVTNTAASPQGASCVLSVFGAGVELGTTTVRTSGVLAAGATSRGSVLVPLDGSRISSGNGRATIACSAGAFVSK